MILNLSEQWVELQKLSPKSEKHNNDQNAAAYKIKISGIFESAFFDQFDDKPLELTKALYHPDGTKRRGIRGISLKGSAKQHVVALSVDRGNKVTHEFEDATLDGFTARPAEEGKIAGSFWLFVEPTGKHAEKKILFINNLLIDREFKMEILPPPPGANENQKDLPIDD